MGFKQSASDIWIYTSTVDDPFILAVYNDDMWSDLRKTATFINPWNYN